MNVLIVGAGVVGQATGKGLSRHTISYVDIDPIKVGYLIEEGYPAFLPDQVQYHHYEIVMICVPTPTIDGKQYLYPVLQAIASITSNPLIVIRSTILPGTTENILKTRFPYKRLACNPEFLRAHSAQVDFDTAPLSLLGVFCQSDFDTLSSLCNLAIQCTPTEAEMIKYVHNCFNALKISYFNEIWKICESLDLSEHFIGKIVSMTCEGMKNPLYGIYGGKPYGGACLPKDTEAFLTFLKENELPHSLLESTIKVNKSL